MHAEDHRQPRCLRARSAEEAPAQGAEAAQRAGQSAPRAGAGRVRVRRRCRAAPSVDRASNGRADRPRGQRRTAAGAGRVVTVTLDTNILLYASDESSPFHGSAIELLERLATGP